MRVTRARYISRSLIPLAAVSAGALVGCGDDDKATKSATPAQFAIEATADGKKKALAFPKTVKAGLVTMTLKNTDKVSRSAGIVRLVGDHSVEEFLKAVKKLGAPIPAWIEDGGGVPGVEPGETASVTQVLASGRYAITDDETEGGQGEGPTYAEFGAKGEFTVSGEAGDATLPAVPATLTAKDYSFEFAGLKAGTNSVRFENTGSELHHAILLPINKGKTLADAKAAFASDEPSKGPPPVDFENGLNTQVIDGGIAQNIELELNAGRYAVICFIQDRAGGAPHVAKGMISELTVK